MLHEYISCFLLECEEEKKNVFGQEKSFNAACAECIKETFDCYVSDPRKRSSHDMRVRRKQPLAGY